MSILLVSAVDPFPTDAGKKVVLAGFLDYLIQRYGAESVHYVLVGSSPPDRFPVTLHPVPGPSRRDVMRNFATKVATGRSSMQEAFLGSPRIADAIHRIIDSVRPHIEVYDTVRMAQYAPRTDTPQICYLDDLFSERYSRMLAAAKRYPDVHSNPLGNFADHIPGRLRPLADGRLSQNLLLRAERALIRRSEDRAARRFPRCLLVNDREAEVLERRAAVPPGRIQCLPPLLATQEMPQRDYRGAPEFVFLGLLSLPHNDDGLRWFLREVWPLVLNRLPSARLRVIGRHAGPEVLAVVAQLGGSVSIDGYVPDLGDALGQAAAMVNPLRFGSGIKLKVIEALGRALPVVSTEVGAEGIACGPGSGVMVAKDGAQIAELLCSTTDPDRNAELSAEARQHFLTTYSRQAVFDVYDRAFAVPMDMTP